MNQKTMKKKSELLALAGAFLTEENKAKRVGILLKAEKILAGASFKNKKQFLEFCGVSYFASINSSQKIAKGKKENYNSLILYLSASKNAGVELCSFASAGCRLACLVGAGHALLEKRAGKLTIARARVVKSWVCHFRADLARAILQAEIITAQKSAQRAGASFCVRLNGTSDISWNELIEKNPDIQFYDYTKNPERQPRKNYHLTFSYSMRARLTHYKQALCNGLNLAVPIIKADFDKCLQLAKTFDADITDLRFLDKQRAGFALLRAKTTENSEAGEQYSFLLNFKQFKKLHSALV